MTDETKHTAGPWWIEERGDVISIIGPRENCSHNGQKPAWELAKIDNYVFWGEPETEAEDRANARLIAVSPDFYKAALKLISAFDELQSTTAAERILTGRSDAEIRKASNEAMAELRSALAKADGRSK